MAHLFAFALRLVAVACIQCDAPPTMRPLGASADLFDAADEIDGGT